MKPSDEQLEPVMAVEKKLVWLGRIVAGLVPPGFESQQSPADETYRFGDVGSTPQNFADELDTPNPSPSVSRYPVKHPFVL